MDSHLRQPEVKVLDAGVEVLLLVGLFEFLAFFCRFVDKELPLLIQSTEACLRNSHSHISYGEVTGLSLLTETMSFRRTEQFELLLFL